MLIDVSNLTISLLEVSDCGELNNTAGIWLLASSAILLVVDNHVCN